MLDVSGSMHGFPLDTAKALMRDLLPRLRPVDRSTSSSSPAASFVLSPGESLDATPEHVRRALDTFDHQQGGGGTELMQALRTAYDLPRADRRVARSVVVVTDGYVGVEAQAFRFVRERLYEASCFAFGIGSSVNRGAHRGAGARRPGRAVRRALPERRPRRRGTARADHRSPGALADSATGPRASMPVRSCPARLPDLLAERPVTLLGRYHGAPRRQDRHHRPVGHRPLPARASTSRPSRRGGRTRRCACSGPGAGWTCSWTSSTWGRRRRSRTRSPSSAWRTASSPPSPRSWPSTPRS